MEQLLTLKALLEQANMKVWAFDVGRSLVMLDHAYWNRFEHGDAIWPTAVQRHAHFALLGYDESTEQSIAWSFKLPLDEQSRLNLGARDQLIETLITRASDNATALQQGDTKELKSAAADLAQSITLSIEKQARFHALARKALNLPNTEQYQRVIELIDARAFDDWASLPLQGLAELAVRHDEQGNTQRLCHVVDQLPLESLQHLAAVVDGEPVKPALSKAFASRLRAQLKNDVSNTQHLLIAQALSHAPAPVPSDIAREIICSSQGVSSEGISIIAGRFWRTLQDPDLARQFLENLVMLDQGQSFAPVIQQLLFLSDIRAFILAALNDPQRSDALEDQVNRLLKRSS